MYIKTTQKQSCSQEKAICNIMCCSLSRSLHIDLTVYKMGLTNTD